MAQYTVKSGEVVSGLNLHYSDYMRVESGGTAILIIFEESSIVVSSGGTAIRTQHSSDSTITVQHGGVASITYVGDEALLAVGGKAYGAEVDPGGSCKVNSGGTAYNVNLSGTMTVSGVAVNTTINYHGSMNVQKGGTASLIDVSKGGKLVVESGGTAMSVTENGGYVEYESPSYVTFEKNMFTGLTLSKTSVTVHSGTLADKITLKDAQMYVYEGGEADSGSIRMACWPSTGAARRRTLQSIPAAVCRSPGLRVKSWFTKEAS